LIIIGFLFAFFPQVYPMAVDPTVKSMYDYIEGLPKGSVVLLDWSIHAIASSFMDTAYLATVGHFFLRHGDIKFVCFGVSPTTIPMWNLLMTELTYYGLKDRLTYGVDYVFLGYVAGEETGLASFTANIRGVVSKDYYGTPIDNLPLMAHGNPKTGGAINDGSDFAVAWPNAFTILSETYYIRIWGDLWHIPLIMPSSDLGVLLSGVLPYYPKYIKLYFTSEKQVQYEYLEGLEYHWSGPSMLYYAQRSYVSMGMVALLALVNVAYFVERRSKAKLPAAVNVKEGPA
jgi:hypothetical protein